MIFDSSVYFNYLDKCKDSGINIPQFQNKSQYIKAQCEFSEKFFGLKVPNELKTAVSKLNDPAIAREHGLKYAIDLCDELKNGFCVCIYL